MQARPASILLVEDDAAHARLLSRWLDNAGYAVTVVTSAGAATARMGEPWDILVSDIDLPDGNGLELAAQSKEAMPRRPVLLLTAQRDVDLALAALRARVDDLLLKLSPLRPEVLTERVASLLATAARPQAPLPRHRVLAIGAHPDDIEIGCGGALARHAALGHAIHILTLSAGESGGDPELRRQEAGAAAAQLSAELSVAGLADRHLDGPPTIEHIERVIARFQPTAVYTHSEHDTHQDHRAVHHATLVAARRVANVYCYQSPSTTPEFHPTMFIDVSNQLQAKLELIHAHASQANVHPYLEDELLVATGRYWGRFASARYAEAFEVVRASSPTG